MLRRTTTFTAALTLVIALASGIPADAGGCHPDAAKATEATALSVSIARCAFSPTVLRVPVGATVQWTNDDFLPHAIDGAGWAANMDSSGMFGPGATVTHAFAQAGVYTYMCHLHPGMSGVVVVGDAAFPSVPTTTVAAAADGPAQSAAGGTPQVDARLAGILAIVAATVGYVSARRPRFQRASPA